MGALHSNCVILQTGQTYQSKCVTKQRSICWGLLPRVYGSHQWITYTKLNPHMCPLSDQKDFGIHHHIREKRCGTQLNWTRGHTVWLEHFAGWCRGLPRTTTWAKHLWHIPNDQKWGKAEKCISTYEDSEQANPCCKRWRNWDCPSVKHSDRGEMIVKKSQIGQFEDVTLNMKMIKWDPAVCIIITFQCSMLSC